MASTDSAPEGENPASAENGEDSERNSRMLKAGIGIGVGSAAVVAALLYANKSRKKKKPSTRKPDDTD